MRQGDKGWYALLIKFNLNDYFLFGNILDSNMLKEIHYKVILIIKENYCLTNVVSQNTLYLNTYAYLLYDSKYTFIYKWHREKV